MSASPSDAAPSSPAHASLQAALASCRAIAILRASSAERFPAILDVLADAGLKAVELTFTTPGVLDAIAAYAARKPDDVAIGAGTVLTAEQARHAVDAGATYLISPSITLDVIAEAHRLGVPVIPGALTPTEIWQADVAGATMVKVFPAASLGGPAYLTALRGPLPNVALVPTGGVTIESVADYLDAGASAVGLGSPLQGDAAAPDGDLTALAGRARRVVEVAGRG